MTDPNQPAAITQDDVLRIVSETVNKAIASRDKMSDKKREEDKLAFAKLLDEKLAGFKPGELPADPSKKPKDLEIETLRRQLTEQGGSLEEIKRERDLERAKNRAAALDRLVVESLANVGKIDGISGRMALAALKSTGRVGYGDEEGEPDKIVFRDDSGVAVDLATGMKGWLKTEEGKFFLPPTGVRGAGTRPGGIAPGGNGKLTPDDQKAALAAIFEDAFG